MVVDITEVTWFNFSMLSKASIGVVLLQTLQPIVRANIFFGAIKEIRSSKQSSKCLPSAKKNNCSKWVQF